MPKKRFIALSFFLMKISVIQLLLVICFIVPSFANDVYSQSLLEKMVSISVEDAEIKKVITEIEKKTGAKFSYSSDIINVTKKISFSAKNMKLADLLNAHFKPLKIYYSVLDEDIILLFSKNATAQITPNPSIDGLITNYTNLSSEIMSIPVTGKVKDENGAPLEGAVVQERGTNNKTVTNKKGEFTLRVKDDKAVLEVSFVGYAFKQIFVNGERNLYITLSSTAKTLEDVVVVDIGYQKVRKSDVTGAVSKMSTEESANLPVASIDQFMQGRVSGVQITQNSGAPGSGMSFLIRGATSISGSNQPLFIIDGYPVETGQTSMSPTAGADFFSVSVPPTNPLAAINPNDIESIEVLKDASSTAIYGSRGANGVVIITTKRGKNKKDQFNFSSRVDFSYIPKKIEVLRTSDYIDYVNEANVNSGFNPRYNYTNAQKDSVSKATNYFWQDLIYQTSRSVDNQFSVLGGDDKTKYALSANFRSLQGIVKNSSFNTGSIRLNIDRQATNKLKISSSFSANINVNKAAQQGSNNGDATGSVITGGLIFSPLQIPFNENGEDPNTSINGNPVTLITLGKNVSTAKVLLANVKLEYKLSNAFTFLINSGANTTNAVRNVFQPIGTFTGTKVSGLAIQSTSDAFNYLIENTLNFNKTFLRKNRINAVIGYTWQYWNSKVTGIQSSNFASQILDFNNLTLASSFVVTASGHQARGLSSYLSRINYSYDNRLLITATARMDGSTVLAEGHKWALFPSLAFGWNLHNEQFLKNHPIVKSLKLRASYGVSGNQSVGVGSSVERIGTGRVITGGTNIVSGLVPISMANKNLKWETTGSYNLGFDGTFFKKKVNVTVDFYSRKTQNLLVNLPIPGSTGFTGYVTNGGSVINKGVDVEVSCNILEKKFLWKVTGNISFNRNRIEAIKNNTQLFGPTSLTAASLSVNQPINTALAGYPIGALYGYKIDGIYQNASEIEKGPVDPTKPTPGSIRYKDLNNDGVISLDDRTIIGVPYPKYTFGITNTFSYKSIALSFLVMGNIGQKVANLNRVGLDAMTLLTNGNVRKEAWENRWRGEGTSNYYPRATANGLVFNQRISDFFVEDGSFVRLKNVTLSYSINIPKRYLVNSCKAFVTATNLITITKYKGYDPEVNAFPNSALSPGSDFGTIPQYKTFSAGLNIGF